MSGHLAAGQPSAMAVASAIRFANTHNRFPLALSSDNSDGGAPLHAPDTKLDNYDRDSHIATTSGVATNANDDAAVTCSPPARVPSKLNATSAPFIPSRGFPGSVNAGTIAGGNSQVPNLFSPSISAAHPKQSHANDISFNKQFDMADTFVKESRSQNAGETSMQGQHQHGGGASLHSTYQQKSYNNTPTTQTNFPSYPQQVGPSINQSYFKAAATTAPRGQYTGYGSGGMMQGYSNNGHAAQTQVAYTSTPANAYTSTHGDAASGAEHLDPLIQMTVDRHGKQNGATDVRPSRSGSQHSVPQHMNAQQGNTQQANTYQTHTYSHNFQSQGTNGGNAKEGEAPYLKIDDLAARFGPASKNNAPYPSTSTAPNSYALYGRANGQMSSSTSYGELPLPADSQTGPYGQQQQFASADNGYATDTQGPKPHGFQGHGKHFNGNRRGGLTYGTGDRIQQGPRPSRANTKTSVRFEDQNSDESTSNAGDSNRGTVIQPNSAIPEGYRGGLTGSASDGMILAPRGQMNYATSGPLVPYHPRSGSIVSTGQVQTLGPLVLSLPNDMTRSNRSRLLNTLTGPKGTPRVQDVMDPHFFPFTEGFRRSVVTEHAVVKVMNIPFKTNRAEIIALLGRNSKILNDRDEPVHIIMDRVSAKTMDAYVEFYHFQDAVTAVEKFYDDDKKANTRTKRLDDRPIELSVSSQTALMRDLFPLAAGVKWMGARAELVYGSMHAWDNFRGFFTEEEMRMVVKGVENPKHGYFADHCRERPFENMISFVKKFPWYLADSITIRERNSVYKTVYSLTKHLVHFTKKNPHDSHLTPQLLKRLVRVTMLSPGFSVLQKDNIAVLVRMPEWDIREFNQPRFGDQWTHQYTLCPKENYPIDILEWYISVIREETKRCVEGLNIGRKQELEDQAKDTNGYWGYLWVELNLPTGWEFDALTLSQVSKLEWAAIDAILRRAFEGGLLPEVYLGRDDSPNGPPRITY